MKFGLVGLPNVGKSTIFNKIVGQELARAGNFPFCTIDPNSATAYVMDPKITKLAELSKSEKVIYPRLEAVDIAGLVEGASQGAGLGNQFLSHIRQVDMILHVVRCFADPDVQHVNSIVNPIADAHLINAELIIADIDMCEKILSNRKTAKLYSASQLKSLEKAMNILQKDKLIRSDISSFNQDDLKFIDERGLITAKPMLYVANVDENVDLTSLSAQLGRIIPINPMKSGEDIDELIRSSYKELSLITFYTTGPTETRGWSIKSGTPAKKAAGVIHSDFEKKFIAAAVVKYDDFIVGQSKPKIEGAAYLIRDADICEFRVGR